jgi:hypothetical protein
MAELHDAIKPFRLQMSQYERRHPWLPLLLDCYALIDLSVAEISKQSGKKIACRKGCSVCCYHVIPLSVIECLGIKFYIQNILKKDIRLLLLKKIHENKSICLFNMDGCCSVYPLRPIACRRYVVAGKCCEMDEDPTVTRPGDVLEPAREYLCHAVEMTLRFYESQNIHIQENEHIFEFYKRQNVKLSSVYESILS